MGFLFAPPLAFGFFASFFPPFFPAAGFDGDEPFAGEFVLAGFLLTFGFGFEVFGFAAGFFAGFGLLPLRLDFR